MWVGKDGRDTEQSKVWTLKQKVQHMLHGATQRFDHGYDCLGGKKIALQGGDGTEAHLPNPPLPLLGRRAGRGDWAGAALPAVPGGGGSDPNIHGSK